MSMLNNIRTSFRNNTKRSIALTAGGALVAAALVGAGSAALFTSTDTAASYAATGSVELLVSDKFEAQNVLPGVARTAPLVIDNSKSSTAVSVDISKVSKANVNNPGSADFSEYTFKIVDSSGKTVYGPVAANGLIPAPLEGVVIPAKGTWTGQVVWELAADAGDEYQKLAVHYASVSFTGTQVLPAK
jgi:hypothetical protein